MTDTRKTRQKAKRPTEGATFAEGAAPVQSKADKRHQEELLDEAIEETFPGSDPISPSHVD